MADQLDRVVILCERVPEVELGLTFGFHHAGPWHGAIVASTHPDDQEVVARLHDGERLTLLRAFPSYPVWVCFRLPGCLPLLCGKMEPGKSIVVQRVGTTIMFPEVKRLSVVSDND